MHATRTCRLFALNELLAKPAPFMFMFASDLYDSLEDLAAVLEEFWDHNTSFVCISKKNFLSVNTSYVTPNMLLILYNNDVVEGAITDATWDMCARILRASGRIIMLHCGLHAAAIAPPMSKRWMFTKVVHAVRAFPAMPNWVAGRRRQGIMAEF